MMITHVWVLLTAVTAVWKHAFEREYMISDDMHHCLWASAVKITTCLWQANHQHLHHTGSTKPALLVSHWCATKKQWDVRHYSEPHYINSNSVLRKFLTQKTNRWQLKGRLNKGNSNPDSEEIRWLRCAAFVWVCTHGGKNPYCRLHLDSPQTKVELV